MANQITGKVVAISDIEEIKSSDPSRSPIKKRKVVIDCTRFDPNTGEPGIPNTPMLEFAGKALEKLDALKPKKDDLVTISFDIQGIKYDKNGKKGIFTAIRPYAIEMRMAQQPAAPATATAMPDPVAKPDDDLPF